METVAPLGKKQIKQTHTTINVFSGFSPCKYCTVSWSPEKWKWLFIYTGLFGAWVYRENRPDLWGGSKIAKQTSGLDLVPFITLLSQLLIQ